MRLELHRLPETALEPRDRLLEDRHARRTLANRVSVQHRTFMHGGLGERTKDAGVLTVPEIHRECFTLSHETIGNRLAVHRDSDKDGIHGDLCHPGLSHPVPFVPGARPDKTQCVRDRPRDCIEDLCFHACSPGSRWCVHPRSPAGQCMPLISTTRNHHSR